MNDFVVVLYPSRCRLWSVAWSHTDLKAESMIQQHSDALWTPTGSILLNTRSPSGDVWVCVCLRPLTCPTFQSSQDWGGGYRETDLFLPLTTPSHPLSFVCVYVCNPHDTTDSLLVWAVIQRRRAEAETERWRDCGQEWKQQWDTTVSLQFETVSLTSKS